MEVGDLRVVRFGAHLGLSHGEGLCWCAYTVHVADLRCQGKKNTLSNTNRPREIGEWFQHGRRWDKQPLVGPEDIDRFSVAWWKWWSELQPASRATKDAVQMLRQPPNDGEWHEALKGTNNGLYVVLVALGWWVLGARLDDRNMEAWNHAASDVIWAIGQMKLVGEETQKRPHEDGDGESVGSPCKTKR